MRTNESGEEGRDMGHLDNTGKFISFILRHHPEAIGIKLDEHGWAQTEDLISGIAKSRKFDMQMLEEIVRTDILLMRTKR